MDLPVENQRIRQIIDYFCDGNESLFSKEIGISQPRINRLFSLDPRNNKYPLVSFEIVQATINKFINISGDWIITGYGTMFKQGLNNLSVVGEPKEVYKLKTDKLINDHQQIPLYNLEATAGIVTLFRDSQETQPIDFIQIPNLPKCDGALYVTGDSMYPLLKSGDIIMYKQIHNIQDGIYWGEMYLISVDQDGDELVLVKYIQKSEKGDNYIRLVSQNQHHQDKDVKLSKIKALALVKASIRINSMS